jgi:DNA-binding MarR family transcriptional regulator
MKQPYILEDNVGFILRQVTQRHVAIFTELMPDDLTPTQFSVLIKLQEHGGVAQTQLGRLTAMDAATIKGVVDRLARRGLVAQERDTVDGRVLIVSLTPAASAVLRRATPAAARITLATLAPLDADEQQTLLTLLRRLV